MILSISDIKRSKKEIEKIVFLYLAGTVFALFLVLFMSALATKYFLTICSMLLEFHCWVALCPFIVCNIFKGKFPEAGHGCFSILVLQH